MVVVLSSKLNETIALLGSLALLQLPLTNELFLYPPPHEQLPSALFLAILYFCVLLYSTDTFAYFVYNQEALPSALFLFCCVYLCLFLHILSVL